MVRVPQQRTSEDKWRGYLQAVHTSCCQTNVKALTGNSALILTRKNHTMPSPYLDPLSPTQSSSQLTSITSTHTHPFNGPFPGLPRWASTREVKPIWILLKQETVSGSGISWVICKSATRSRQITTPASHHSVFYRPDALPAAQPTASKHWRQSSNASITIKFTEFTCTS